MPSVIDWSDDLIVNIEAIDNDHKKLFALANQFFSSASAGSDGYATISALWNYTKEHFVREEESMMAAKFDGLAKHKAEHEYLILQLDYLSHRLMQEGTEAIKDSLSRFLKEWLENHIKGFDAKFAAYLRKTNSAD